MLFSQTDPYPRTKQLGQFPARSSADWVHRAVIYEIYTRSFSPEGTFSGIEKKLPELKSLGVTVLWLMPIHPVGIERRKGALGSPYSVQDYYGINPEFGTLDDFRRLVEGAHKQNLKLIIDLVANHTAWDSKLIKSHPEWFTHDSGGIIVAPNPDWTDVADLDYSHSGLRDYMIAMMKYWVRDVGVDGFRCDVSEMVPTDFWETARASLDSIKPVIMLSEGTYPEHHLKAFDLTYGWNSYGLLSSLLAHKVLPDRIDSLLAEEQRTFPAGSLRLRFSSNHDENAWDKADVEKFGIAGAKLAAAIVNTLPGVPLMYNGQEVANPTRLALFERVPINWNVKNDFHSFYSQLYTVRSKHTALANGSFTRIRSSNNDRLYLFLRAVEGDRILAAYNFDSSPIDGTIDAAALNLRPQSRLRCTDLMTNKVISLRSDKSGKISLTVPSSGFLLLALDQ
jgi:glycosidase